MVVEVPRHPRAVEQMHPRAGAGGLPASVDLLQYGAQRRQAGTACHHEEIRNPPVLGQGELLADRGAQLDRVALAQPPDRRCRDESAGDRLDVELHTPRGLGSVGWAEVAPQPGRCGISTATDWPAR